MPVSLLWVISALLAAFFVASADALCKKALENSNEYLITWVRVGYASPFLIAVLPFIKIPSLDTAFFFPIIFLVPLEITALILYIKAIKASPLSLTLPFLALTPVFLIPTSFFMLGERPGKFGLVGIFLVTAGAYLLNIHTTHKGFLEPFKAIGRERGSVLVIIVAFIYSITSNLGKMAIQHSSPVFFGCIYPIILGIVLFPIMKYKCNAPISVIFSRPKIFALIGASIALMMINHCIAVNLTDVSYMISVKRTSLLFGIMYGALIFKEVNIKERLLGSIVMIMGVLLITLL
ncbi:MAG: EamA family transporter [Candidatus Brocadiales bacterium]